MTNKEFKVGDKVRYEGSSRDLTIKTINLSPSCYYYATFEEECVPISLARLRFVKASPQSPVRTVTRQEIVPGVYGCVSVQEFSPHEVMVSICGAGCLDVSELEQAAQVFLDLAKALKENEK